MPDNTGLAAAASQVQSAGRGPDTMLAHVSPDEAKFIDYLQGGRKTNPMTGLPEYGMFGDILKAVARAAGAIGGFMIGGPAGAALGSGAATKLTGGSWKDAATGAALSGIGGFAGQALTGGGTSLIGGAGSAAHGAAAGATEALSSAPGMAGAIPSGLPAGAAQAINAAVPTSFMGVAQSWPGIAAGLGSLMTPLNKTKGLEMPSSSGSSVHLDDVLPMERAYMPFTGDLGHYGETGGGEHQFFSPVNAQAQYKKKDPLAFAAGGPVEGIPAPQMGFRGVQGRGIQMPTPGPQMNEQWNSRGLKGPNGNRDQMRQAALLGYSLAAARGGAVPSPAARMGVIHGPGGPEDDLIPARLSDGEHVVDSRSITLLGNGSNDKGQKAMELIKQEIRRNGGATNVKNPPTARMVARAKRRAGVK